MFLTEVLFGQYAFYSERFGLYSLQLYSELLQCSRLYQQADTQLTSKDNKPKKEERVNSPFLNRIISSNNERIIEK